LLSKEETTEESRKGYREFLLFSSLLLFFFAGYHCDGAGSQAFFPALFQAPVGLRRKPTARVFPAVGPLPGD
jgi:hypothetical protein